MGGSSNLHEDQERHSLTDFPVAQDHRNPSSSFEFFQGGLSYYSEENMVSHAEDIIFCGKLIPINHQLSPKQPPQKSDKHHRSNQQNQPLVFQRPRSESSLDVKTTTVGPLIRNSRPLGYKKLKRNSSMSLEPVAEKKSASSSWRHVIMYGLVNVPPPEINIQNLKNRQVRLNSSKTSTASSKSADDLSVSRNVDHRKSSWRVLELLSCKSSSASVITPLGYMAKV